MISDITTSPYRIIAPFRATVRMYRRHSLIGHDVLQPGTRQRLVRRDPLVGVQLQHPVEQQQRRRRHEGELVAHATLVEALGPQSVPEGKVDHVGPHARDRRAAHAGDHLQLHHLYACLGRNYTLQIESPLKNSRTKADLSHDSISTSMCNILIFMYDVVVSYELSCRRGGF